MARFKNVSAFGELDIPAVGRVVQSGEEFDVPDDLAASFAGQVGTYEPVDAVAVEAEASRLADDGQVSIDAHESTTEGEN